MHCMLLYLLHPTPQIRLARIFLDLHLMDTYNNVEAYSLYSPLNKLGNLLNHDNACKRRITFWYIVHMHTALVPDGPANTHNLEHNKQNLENPIIIFGHSHLKEA